MKHFLNENKEDQGIVMGSEDKSSENKQKGEQMKSRSKIDPNKMIPQEACSYITREISRRA